MKLSLLSGRLAPNYTYYGQLREDEHIHKRYFPTLRGGVFLEMGALDGIEFSNTKFFEDTMKWTGVLIEPIPSSFKDLSKNRPNSKAYQVAISKTEGEIEIYAHGAVSSVKSNTTDVYFDGWHKGHNIPIIKVPSIGLDKVLRHAGITRIDFWSLDVEGSEYEALETMDWSIPVYLICIEKQTDYKDRCETILRANGFILFETFHHNEIWINPSHRRKN